MRILLIEDDDNKASSIINTLKVLGEKDVVRKISRNSGLREWDLCKDTENSYDFIITDNFLPIYDDDYRNISPQAKSIVNMIRHRDTFTPICICSSEDFDLSECDANYKIVFNYSYDLSEDFLKVFEKVKSEKK